MISIETLQNRIIQGDCVQVMKEMESACVNLIVTDPPDTPSHDTGQGWSVDVTEKENGE